MHAGKEVEAEDGLRGQHIAGLNATAEVIMISQ